MVDVAALVAPLSDEVGAKAGPDLTYEDSRSQIEAPFQLDADGTPVDERQWRDCIKAIIAEAGTTRDIWLATYLTRAGAKIGDLQTVVDGTEMLAGLLENIWDEVHPTLDEADFVGRKTPCDSLTKIREFLGPLKRVILFEHRLGKFSGEDIDRFATIGEEAENYGQFRAAIGSSDPAAVTAAFQEAVAKLDAIRASIKRADAVLVANAGSETGTNFTPTYEVLDSIRKAALPYAGMAAEPESEAADDVGASMGAAAGGGGGATGPALSGRVNSREDVIRAIDAICDYYKAREPTSPVQTLMKRARHWVTMDFLELIDELMPDSLASAKKLLVSKIDDPAAESSSGW